MSQQDMTNRSSGNQVMNSNVNFTQKVDQHNAYEKYRT